VLCTNSREINDIDIVTAHPSSPPHPPPPLSPPATRPSHSSARAYGFPALQSSPWLPGAHVPHPPPALSSRQAPPTSLTSLSRIPTFPARRRRRNSGAAMTCSQSPHLSLIRNHRQPHKNLACTPLVASFVAIPFVFLIKPPCGLELRPTPPPFAVRLGLPSTDPNSFPGFGLCVMW